MAVQGGYLRAVCPREREIEGKRERERERERETLVQTYRPLCTAMEQHLF